MKHLLTTTFLFSLFCTTTWAQHWVKGKVTNENNTPIDFAEILLTQPKDVLIKQVFSDENGTFVIEDIPSGDYDFKIVYFGKNLNNQKLSLTESIDLGVIQIKDNNQLDEIVVQAEKKLIERKVDRLVFNTANSISSQGMNAIEALTNTPLVKVVDDKVSIVGKSGVTIMVDDRPLYLSGDALTNYLKTLRSDDIERIEVITSPPARYEASGNSGMINIVLKKNKTMGLYGTASGSYSYNNNPSYNANGSVNFQNKKWSIMLKANGNDGHYQSENNYTYTEATKGMASNSDWNSKYKSVGGNLTTNYQITDNALVGITYDITRMTNDSKRHNKTIYSTYPQAVIDSTITSLSNGDSKNYYHTLNTFFDHKLDTLGSKLSLGVNYFANIPDNTNTIVDYNAISAISNQMYYTNKLDYNVWSATADLSYKLKWADVEIGGKYTNYDNKATVNYYNWKNDDYVLDNKKSNRFNYAEDNYAAYFSLSKKLSDKWQVKGGLRYEQTEVKGHLLDTDEKFTKSYGKWFPTAYISFDPNDNHSFSFNYAKRINRPYSNILNPFRYYENKYSYNSGNPELSPAITNNFELNYVFNSTLSFTLNYNKLTDSFDQLATFENGIMASTYYNMLNQESYGIDVSYSNKILPWWETNTGANYYYAIAYYRAQEASQVPQNGPTFSYYSQNTFNVNNAKTVKLFLNWYHQLPNKEDNTKYNSYKTLSTGAKFALLDKKLNINVTLSDIFNTGKSSGTMYYENNTQTFANKWNSRRLNLSASYSFGNSSNKKQIKEANFEDKNRSN
ncbi:TonB-dependent receptor [Myroides phaeus]|uniref:TonB-dependent receptor n=1 Tax=Myroides phaeus TaxID=702745 RepID=UPI002DB6FCF6|nr:TonB-dependent receptor [Myroides phaeus]MEC4115493.1 TonB-dependent receptor [Myroides phaeus]